MNTPRLASLCLTALFGLASAGVFADASTGANNPSTGSPPAVGAPSGSGSLNDSGDGTTKSPSSPSGNADQLKPQNSGNPEGSSMGGAATKPQNGVNSIQKGGTGSEGGSAGGATK